jgi:predicted ATPase/DNA-binding winged helix-turn-helix (wHTH) protein
MTPTFARVTYRFGPFECDAAAYELRRDGRRVRLARQPMDLLLLLLGQPRQLVSREEIKKHLWGENVFVDLDAGIRTAILKIRQALGDSRGSSRFVETVPGKGYRFIAPLGIVPSSAPTPIAGAGEFEAPAARRHNLPADLTSFVGRETALAELRTLLATSRLLSLTGSGGVGKTRLAIRLASDLIGQFSGGVWMVDLASISAPDMIAQAVAAPFAVRETPQRSLGDGLRDYLRNRELLLVFDTCEHLIGPCAELVESLLRASPGLKIIATSREPLRLPGETFYRVPSLSVPETSYSPDSFAQFESTKLFVERAMAVQPEFRPHPSTFIPIAAICRRLDGIPLAIELAAAQVAFLSLHQIEARLADKSLVTGTRTSVARQRTLDAAVDWSYQLLSETERLLFSRLSVFPASWTLEAAEDVCSDEGIHSAHMLGLLSRLLSKSLINVDSDVVGDRRYRFLESVRRYAHERLIEAGTADGRRDRHFGFFHRKFRGALHTLSGPNQVLCLRTVQAEQENLRTALDWGLSSPTLAEKGIELASALFWFWTKRGLFSEGRHWLERAAAIPANRALRAKVALGLGHMAYFQGHHPEMDARNDELLELGREEGDAWIVSAGLFGHALCKFESGAFEEAAAFAIQALEIADGEGFGSPLLILGNVALVKGDNNQALALFEEAIARLRRVGDVWGLGILLSLTASLHTIREDFDEARTCASEALLLNCELEDPRGIAWSLEVFAALIAAKGHAKEAARVWGASDSLLDSVGGTLVPTIGWLRNRYLAPAAATIGEHSFASARADGRAMLSQEAIAFASGWVEAAF